MFTHPLGHSRPVRGLLFTDILPDDDLWRSEYVRVFLCIFIYFNIEIGILD